MLGYIRTSITSQTGPICLFTPHPTLFPRTSWPRRVQTVWPRWLSQPWPPLSISHSRVTGPYVQSENCVTTSTGPQAGPVVFLCLLQQRYLTCHYFYAMNSMIRRPSPLLLPRPSSREFYQILSACHWKAHITFTQFYLKDVAFDYSELNWGRWWLLSRSTISPRNEEICIYMYILYIISCIMFLVFV